MLAQFALIVFALCAVLSLVVDVGYARLTQAQMQNAADTAALEGLRHGRPAAHDVVQQVFDDDLDPTNGDPDYQFGAGPIIDLTDGVTTLHAGATIGVPDLHVYKPDLQTNTQDEAHGDMVSGRFCYTDDPAASEGFPHESIPFVCTEPQRATGRYARNDFNPRDPNGNGAVENAFLVRLRRSNEFQDSLGQAEEGIASSGRSLPLLFGRGTTIFADDPSGSYSVRRDGLTVRATAIAQTRPALHVGLPQPNPPQPAVPGVTPFAVVDAFIRTAPAAGAPVTISPANGFICRPSAVPCTAANPNVVGRFVDNLTDPTRTRWTLIDTIGQSLPAAIPLLCAATNSLAPLGPVYYVPVYASIATVNRVIGFAPVRLARNPCPLIPTAEFTAVISRIASFVAASNATALLSGGLPAAFPPADVNALFQHTQSLADASLSLLTPALAR